MIQTGQGSTPVKKVGTDVSSEYLDGRTIYQYQRDQVIEARKWNYLIVGNEFSAEVLKNAYRLRTNQIVESGLPKNDQLFNVSKEKVEHIRLGLGIGQKRHVILYAPTWRDDDVVYVDKVQQKLRIDLEKLEKSIDDDTVILVGFPQLVKDHYPNLEKFANKVIDVTKYPEITDLYLVTDILISDYSSIIFDFANLKGQLFYT